MEKFGTHAGEIIQDTLEEADGLQSKEVALRLSERAARLREAQEAMRAMIGAALDGSPLEQQAAIVEDAADVVAQLGDVRVEQMESTVLGYATLGEDGSTAIDVGKMIHEDGSVNEVDLLDTEAHEDEHEKQSNAPNAAAIIVNGERLRFRKEIVETGAMSRQKMIHRNSAKYQQMFDATKHAIGVETAKDVARSGDMIGLAQELIEQGHTVQVELATAA